MAYLVRIGAIRTNASGIGSRGYVVNRTGRFVIVKFGKIEVVGGGTTQFRWTRDPTVRKHRSTSIARAKALAKSLIDRQLRTNDKGGYQKLPAGVRIEKATG